MQDITLENITKTYDKKNVVAVDDVSLSINQGELFGLIGPDGAGKTSIFRILTTLLLPDSGHASVSGHDVVKEYKKIRSKVGYMPGKFSLYQDLTVEQNLQFFASIFRTTIAENYHLIEDIYKQLEPFKNRKAGDLSGGMKQKLALCCALIHKPSVLFLDEPTTGVDAVSRKEFWEMLKRLKEQEITILVSTPYMDEAALCDRIALMQGGKILSTNTPQQVSESYEGKLFAVKTDSENGAKSKYSLIRDLEEFPDTKNCYAFGEFIHLRFKDALSDSTENLSNYLRKAGHKKIVIKKIKPGIEDRFIQLLKN